MIKLHTDRSKSLRKVLIHVGELATGIEKTGAFDHIVPFGNLL